MQPVPQHPCEQVLLLLLLLGVCVVCAGGLLLWCCWVAWAEVECAELCGKGLMPCRAGQAQSRLGGRAAMVADGLCRTRHDDRTGQDQGQNRIQDRTGQQAAGGQHAQVVVLAVWFFCQHAVVVRQWYLMRQSVVIKTKRPPLLVFLDLPHTHLHSDRGEVLPVTGAAGLLVLLLLQDLLHSRGYGVRPWYAAVQAYLCCCWAVCCYDQILSTPVSPNVSRMMGG